MKSKKFFQNAILLIVSTFVLRLIFTSFRVIVSNKVGAECMGLYQLTFAIYNIAVTIATSGVNYATTRLCAAFLAQNNREKSKGTVKASIVYSLIFSLFSFCVFFFLAEPIGVHLLFDKRSILSIKILAISLPFISVSSAISGYFFAEKKVGVTTFSRAFEQIVQIVCFFVLISIFPQKDVEKNCVIIVLSGALADILGSLFLLSKFLYDNRRIKSKTEKYLNKKVFRTAFFAAVSIYLKSGLQTIENILIPIGFKKHKNSSQNALSSYGIVGSMVMPVIFFPSFVLSSFSMLLVPEFSFAQAQNKNKEISSKTIITVRLTLLFSLVISAIFMVFGRDLGNALYSESLVGKLIVIMAPLIPFMYLDSVADGMLKGLGEYAKVIKYSSIDTVLSIILITFLIPKMGLYGYVAVIYISSMLNALLSIRRLLIVTKNRILFYSDIVVPFCVALFSSVCAKSLVSNNLAHSTQALVLSIISAFLLIAVFVFVSRGKMYDTVKYAASSVLQAVFSSNFKGKESINNN